MTGRSNKNGVSVKGKGKLRKMIEENISVFKGRPEIGRPAKITPIKLRQDKMREEVNIKVRKYHTGQRKVSDEYIFLLVSL